MSPSDIEVLIHCNSCRLPHPRLDAPAVQDAIERFLKAGLIERVEHPPVGACHIGLVWQTTDGGRVLIDALCATPFPVKKWVMP